MSGYFALLILFFFHSRKSFEREIQGGSNEYELLSDVKAQLENLETCLSLLMKLTGFQFTSHSKKTVEKSKVFFPLLY